VFYTPTPEEIAWADKITDSDEALLALVLALKYYRKVWPSRPICCAAPRDSKIIHQKPFTAKNSSTIVSR
jgi:hypothetical protein